MSQIILSSGGVIRSMGIALPYLLGIGSSRKVVTEEYPDPTSSKSSDILPVRYRGELANEMDRCTGCLDCEKVCPLSCIEIEVLTVPGREKKWVKRFDLNLGSCIYCGVCAMSCPAGSLTHTKNFKRVSTNLDGLVLKFGLGDLTTEKRESWGKFIEKDLI